MFYDQLSFSLDICDLQEKVISTSLGVVTSPNYPANYPPNEDCKVTFQSDGPTQGYMLKFDGMHIGERRFVIVYCIYFIILSIVYF